VRVIDASCAHDERIGSDGETTGITPADIALD